MMIYHMQSRLTELARTWYDHLTIYAYTWDEWNALIRRTFPDHRDFAATLKLLVGRVKRPEETMTKYYFAKMDLLQTCKINGKDAVSCIIDCICDRTIQNSAKTARYEIPEQLYEEYLSTIADEVPTIKAGRDEHETQPKRLFDKQRLGERNSSNSSKTHPNRFERGASTKDRMCYNCREIGHVSTQCSKPRVECTKCKKLEHDETKCSKAYAAKKNVDAKLVESQSDLQSCYFTDCKINGQDSRAYIDTGCSVVTIRNSEVTRLELPFTKIVRGYGGGSVPVLGKVRASLSVDLVEAEVTMLVVTDSAQSVPVLIGQTFLNGANVTVVMKEGRLRLFNSAMLAVEPLPPTRMRW